MNDWPELDETLKLLDLIGLSGCDRQLVEWYIDNHDYTDCGNTEWENDHASYRIRLNSLLQSRFFELNPVD